MDTSASLKIKPLLSVIHRPFSIQGVEGEQDQASCNTEGQCRSLAVVYEWLHEVFTPTMKKYLSDNQLLEGCLLSMGNALPYHPASVDEVDTEYDFIKVKFPPCSMIPLSKPVGQQVICDIKSLYMKTRFTRWILGLSICLQFETRSHYVP